MIKYFKLFVTDVEIPATGFGYKSPNREINLEAVLTADAKPYEVAQVGKPMTYIPYHDDTGTQMWCWQASGLDVTGRDSPKRRGLENHSGAIIRGQPHWQSRTPHHKPYEAQLRGRLWLR